VPDEELLQAATAVRRGSTRLARRLRMERPEPAASELSNLALGVLGHLYQRGPMTPGALAAAERLQPQSLTRVLARLERLHLIERGPDDQDHRRSLLALTDSGQQALIQDMRQRDDWLATAMAYRLTRPERDLLRIAGGLMERLADAADTRPLA